MSLTFTKRRYDWTSFESISLIDRYAAEHFLKPEAPFSKALALAQLFASSRAGHLYLENQELSRELEDVEIVVQDGSKIYLKKNFLLEQTCLEEWKRLTQAEPLHTLDESAFLKELHQASSLTEEQKKACTLGCKSSVFILTGGPGTGKTYTAGRLLHILQNSLTLSTQKYNQIALTAPTGKAALTLEKSLGAGKAKTLHALLGIKQDGSYPKTTLPYDIILVDEASMIDLDLLTKLLSSIKTGAKLILMGDPYQLPPVDGLPIFPSLVKMHTAKVELTKCLRAETIELVAVAEAIRNGHPLQTIDSKDLESVLTSHLNRFPKQHSNPQEWLTSFQKFRILTPTKVGSAGSTRINQWILKHLPKQALFAIPLMITANDYRMELFNGEIGVLITQEGNISEFSENDFVYFPSGKKIPALLLPPYELAYAMTVHKSQGSEFDEVLLLLPETQESLSIPLLYTAVTRARKSISIFRIIN